MAPDWIPPPPAEAGPVLGPILTAFWFVWLPLLYIYVSLKVAGAFAGLGQALGQAIAGLVGLALIIAVVLTIVAAVVGVVLTVLAIILFVHLMRWLAEPSVVLNEPWRPGRL